MIALTVVVGLELAGRLALVWFEYSHADRTSTALAAERLAGDVRNIMLNQGGPVAARTVYPILRRNFEALGYEIAIVPNAVTVESIEVTHGFTPRGVEPEWSEGAHHETIVPLRADEFCVSCHSFAEPGDILGHVAVRRYRDHRMDEWWSEARVTSIVGMGNVLMHTLVLFLLLRLRMEPLISLRATVGRLGRGTLDLSHRAEVKSDDEFGGLAWDLNQFMDRLEHLVQDLSRVLRQVEAVNTRVGQVSTVAQDQVERARQVMQSTLKKLFRLRDLPTDEWEEELESIADCLADINRIVQEDGEYLSQILLLEDRMETAAENGRILLDRIRLSQALAEEDAPDGESG
ncbi:MAG: methyl-accepting chemotaxis protein [Longimicrobiales bacterium]|nr:methyl-accepting chemotaxis protein [Longimicrobiales bacterium]